MLVKIIIAFAATLAFAVIFQVPRHLYLLCGLSGAVGLSAFLLLQRTSAVDYVAYFVACFILTIFARLLSVRFKTPSTVFLITGIFPLVPGAGIYYTAYYLFQGMTNESGAKGVETLFIAGMISLGILFGFSISQKTVARVAMIGKKERGA